MEQCLQVAKVKGLMDLQRLFKRKKESLVTQSFLLFATAWTVTSLAPLSMGFSRQVYWSELPFPSPEDLPDPGIEPRSPSLEADASPPEPRGKSYLLKQGYKNSGTLNTHTHTHACSTAFLAWLTD